MATAKIPSKRFFEKVNVYGPIPKHKPELGQCWLWTAKGKRSNGGYYGSFKLPRQRKGISAHRWIWETLNRPVEKGEVVDHLCRNTMCVNPMHLECVTQRENILRGTNRAAHYARRTHCNNGHEFTPDNTRITKAGARMCRICRRETSRQEKLRYRKYSGND